MTTQAATPFGLQKINPKQVLNIAFATLLVIFMSMTVAFAQAPTEWKNQEFKVKGTWQVEKRADGQYIVLSDEFKTKNAPDLKIFVSNKPYTAINGSNATDGSALVARLQSSKGGQSYKIPSSVNLNDYQSLIIHCEQYSKLWASTPLK